MNREITHTVEFEAFYRTLDLRSRKKMAQVVDIIRCADVISTKFVKKLVDTEFYEVRISANNEYRVITLAVDNDNIMNATQIIFLNGFIKKSTKDYDSQIAKATTILNTLSK
ncbi:MAG: type II toxin-antitoxin system RelE/ParE family toxin [Alistipes sp.]